MDYTQPFAASNQDAWAAEYEATVLPDSTTLAGELWKAADDKALGREALTAEDWLDELEDMNLSERRLIMDEIGFRPDLYESESEVMF